IAGHGQRGGPQLDEPLVGLGLDAGPGLLATPHALVLLRELGDQGMCAVEPLGQLPVRRVADRRAAAILDYLTEHEKAIDFFGGKPGRCTPRRAAGAALGWAALDHCHSYKAAWLASGDATSEAVGMGFAVPRPGACAS